MTWAMPAEWESHKRTWMLEIGCDGSPPLNSIV